MVTHRPGRKAGCSFFLAARNGEDSPELARYGFAPAKPAVVPAATKAVAVLKQKATRAARHTMGKNQRKKIKGVVDPSIAAKLTGVEDPAPPETPRATERSAAIMPGSGAATTPLEAK